MAKTAVNTLIDCITKHSRRRFFEQGFYSWYRLGTVMSVAEDNLTCKVDCGNIVIDKVKLCLKDADDTIIVKPATNSLVIIEDISGGKQEEYRLLQAQTIEDVIINNLVINGGNNNGLVKIEELNKKLMELESNLNSHTHSGTFSGTIGGATATGDLTVLASTINSNKFSSDFSAFEDNKIKH